MTDKVQVKVSENHFKRRVNIGDQVVTDEPVEVEPDITVRNMVQQGNLVLVEGDLNSDRSEKAFQGDDGSGEEDSEDEGENRESEEPEQTEESEGSLEDLTKNELKEKCEEQDLKKSGNKNELIERLEN